MLNARIVQKPDFAKIARNIDFGTALGLTKTAKQGQAAVIETWESRFTIRNKWLKSPIGPRIKAATRTKLQSEVSMSAHFGPLHDRGGTKIPYKNYIAVPTQFAQPDKKRRIPQRNLPKNLKNAFVMVTESGTRLLVIRKTTGRIANRGIVPMYVLTKRAQIKDGDVFEKPIRQVVDKNLKENIREGIGKAISTMR